MKEEKEIMKSEEFVRRMALEVDYDEEEHEHVRERVLGELFVNKNKIQNYYLWVGTSKHAVEVFPAIIRGENSEKYEKAYLRVTYSEPDYHPQEEVFAFDKLPPIPAQEGEPFEGENPWLEPISIIADSAEKIASLFKMNPTVKLENG